MCLSVMQPIRHQKVKCTILSLQITVIYTEIGCKNVATHGENKQKATLQNLRHYTLKTLSEILTNILCPFLNHFCEFRQAHKDHDQLKRSVVHQLREINKQPAHISKTESPSYEFMDTIRLLTFHACFYYFLDCSFHCS